MGYIDREETPLNCGGRCVLVNQMSERERRISELVEVGDANRWDPHHPRTVSLLWREARQRFLTSEETSLDYAKLASQILQDPLMTAAVLLRFRGIRP